MSDTGRVLLNTSGGMLTVNLATFDEEGRRQAIILKDRERTRPLTEEEMGSREVRKLLSTGDLRDVTHLQSPRAPGSGRLAPRPESPAEG